MSERHTDERIKHLVESVKQSLSQHLPVKAKYTLVKIVAIAQQNALTLSHEIFELCSQCAIALQQSKSARNKKSVEKHIVALALAGLAIKGTIAQDQTYCDEALNTGLLLIDMGHFSEALTALEAGYAVLKALGSKAKRSENVSFLARKAKCHLALGNAEAAEEQLDQASVHFAHLTFEKISEDAYLYEAVSYFMQLDLDLARLAADTGRSRSNLSQFQATLPGYQIPR
jgi:tetratricopeptide (TPR) repeat protein